MKLSELLILVVMISVFLIGFGGWYGNISEAYSVNYTEMRTFNETQRVNTLISEQFEKINETMSKSPSEVEWVLDIPKNLAIAGYVTVTLFLSVPNMLQTMIADMTTNSAVAGMIPTWFTGLVMAIIFIFIIIGIIYMILGREP